MEKAKQILILVILAGVALYFLPTAMDAFGLSAAVATEKNGVLALSTDSGRTFTAAALHANYNVNVNEVARSLTNSAMFFAATDRGIFLSKDSGANWYPFGGLENTVNSGTYVYDILVNPSVPKEVYVAATVGGKGVVYVTRDNFFTLSKVYDDNTKVRALAAGGGVIHFSMSDGRVVEYSPYSQTFVFQPNDVNHIFSSRNSVAYMSTDYTGAALASAAPPRTKVSAVTEAGPLVFIGSQTKLYRSNDYGTHWTIEEPVAEGRSISVIRVFPNSGIVIVGSKGSGFSLINY